jgi:hypothetical protein
VIIIFYRGFSRSDFFKQFSGTGPGTIFYDEPPNVHVTRGKSLRMGDILMRGESV